MTAWALYNEIDPYAADWLENLIAAGHIAPGIVDRRSIVDVEADGLHEFTQIHWFAGIAGWSCALRRAGWPDDRPIWTASLPCQPFSAAGQQKAMNDDRHLWPVFYDLVRKCRPPICVGEQVSSKPALAWWDVVSNDFQTSGYAVAAADTSVAQYGGPHIRQRLYWLAVSDERRCEEPRLPTIASGWSDEPLPPRCGENDERFDDRNSQSGDGASGLAHAAPSGWGEECALGSGQRVGDGTQGRPSGYVDGGEPVRLADADESRSQGRNALPECADQRVAGPDGVAERLADAEQPREWRGRLLGPGESDEAADERASNQSVGSGALPRPNPLHGPWRDADWLFCTDGRWRPIEPGAAALAHGLPRGMGTLSAGVEQLVDLAGCDARSLRDAKRYRVGSLKGYGNAICIEQAEGWMRAVMGTVG